MAGAISSTTQACSNCGYSSCFDFHLPDWLWQNVVPNGLWSGVVCLCCFDSFAKQRGIQYAEYLHVLYFSGQQASFEFRVANAAS